MIFLLIYWLCSFTLSIYCAENPAENIPANTPQKGSSSGQTVTLEFEETVNNQIRKSTYKTPIEHAQLFVTLKNLIEDIGSGLPIPIYNIKNSGTFELLKKLRVILEENQTNTNLSLETKFKNEINATKHTPNFLQDLLLGANYLDGGKRFLEILKAIFTDYITTQELPDPLELPHDDLKKPIAENLLERLLKNSEVKSNTYTINNLRLTSPYPGSANGIACLLENNNLYYVQYFEEKDSKLIATAHALELKVYPTFGISSDGIYLYAQIRVEQADSRSYKSFFHYSKKNEPVNIIGLPHNPNFTAYNSLAQEFITVEINSHSNHCTIAYISCQDHVIKKTISVDIDPKKITETVRNILIHGSWTCIDGQLIGIPQNDSRSQIIAGKEYITFNQNTDTFDVHTFNNEYATDMFFRLEIQYDPARLYLSHYGIHPQRFIPNYQAIIQEKINKKSDKFGRWDFLNLRLYNNDGSTITIADIFSNELKKAIRFMNTQYFNTTYDNILYDAWYIYHAEKQTYQFTQLNTHSPILNHVSKEIKEIYPLLTEAQKKPLLEKYAVEQSKLSQAGVLGSSWKPVALLKSLRRDLGAWYHNVKAYSARPYFKGTLLAGAMVWGILGTWMVRGGKFYQ